MPTPEITVAGSGPSAKNYGGRVTIATKKRSVPSEYVIVPTHHWADPRVYEDPIIWGDPWSGKWVKYYKQFTQTKPSNGLQAFFAAMELFSPDEIGVIGLDNILDGWGSWKHDSKSELRAMQSLARVVDLRDNHSR